MSSLSVTLTFSALASSVTEVVIPFVLNLIFSRLDKLYKAIQFGTVEFVIVRHRYWVQPKFGIFLGLFNVYMNGLMPFIAEKEESMPIDYKQGRQLSISMPTESSILMRHISRQLSSSYPKLSQ